MTANRRPSSALFTLVALVTAVAVLHVAREILLPLALATLISFLLAPAADRLERWGARRIPSVLAVVGAAFLALGLLGWVVTSQLADLSANLDKYKDNIVSKIRTVARGSSGLSKVSDTLEDIGKELANASTNAKAGEGAAGDAASPGEADDAGESALARARAASDGRPPRGDEAAAKDFAAWAADLFSQQQRRGGEEAVAVKVVELPPTPLAYVRAWLGPLVAPLTMAGMVVVIVLFMLLEREDQRNRLIRLFGASNIHATTEALTDVVNRVSRYLRMQFLINAGYGLCVGLGLFAIGLPNAVMWGVLSFSLRFLPYIGPWISAVLPLAVSIADSDGWVQPLVVVGLFVVLELIVNNVAEPLLYGSSIGVSGMGVILAAVFWTWLWGPIGLVLAMPLTVCLVVMARYVPALRFITVLLGDQPTLTLQERIYQRMLALDEEEVRDLADEYLRGHSPLDLYDNVLIPALQLAERDRHEGLLSDEQHESVQDIVRDVVAGLAEAPADGAEQAEPADEAGIRRARALCIPLSGESDKTVGLMLQGLLATQGIDLVVCGADALISERVELVESLEADMVVASIQPPLPLRDSRLLCRGLRKRYPDLPILVGYWNGSAGEELRARLAAARDGEIVATLAEAVERVRAVASRLAPSVEPKSAPLAAATGAVGEMLA